MADVHTCPTCGSTMVVQSHPRVLLDVKLSPLEKSLMNVLVDVYPRGISRNALVDALYANDPNGGPLTALNLVSVYICRLRPKIQLHGWTIAGRYSPALYRLAPYCGPAS